jgi:hypothetical protein
VVRHLELYRSARLSLTNRRPVQAVAMRGYVQNLQRDQITAPQLAVNRKIKYGEVTQATG